MQWLHLAIAIAAEVFATSMLQVARTSGAWWSILATIGGYAMAFAFLGLALNHLSLGVAYAIWSGVGTALVVFVGAVIFGQAIGTLQIAGITLIILGSLMLHCKRCPAPT